LFALLSWGLSFYPLSILRALEIGMPDAVVTLENSRNRNAGCGRHSESKRAWTIPMQQMAFLLRSEKKAKLISAAFRFQTCRQHTISHANEDDPAELAAIQGASLVI